MNLQDDKLLSSVAFDFDLRRYTLVLFVMVSCLPKALDAPPLEDDHDRDAAPAEEEEEEDEQVLGDKAPDATGVSRPAGF